MSYRPLPLALALFAVVAVVAGPAPARAAAPTWSPQAELSSTPQHSRDPVAVDADGNAVTAWVDYVNGTGYSFKASYRPAGGSWTTAETIENGSMPQTDVQRPAAKFLFKADGTPMLFFGGVDNGAFVTMVTERSPDGTWSTPQLVPGTATFGDVVQDDTGRLTVVWNSAGAIWATHRDPGGAWSAQDKVEDVDMSVRPVAGVDGAGNVTVAYQGAARHVRVRRWRPGVLEGWDPVVDLGVSDNAQPRIAVNRVGDAIVTWQDDSSSRTVRGAVRDDAGMWGPVETIINSGQSGQGSAPAVDGAGTAVVVSNIGPSTIVAREHPRGGTWGAQQTVYERAIGSSDQVDAFPQLQVNEAGDAIATWIIDDNTSLGIDGDGTQNDVGVSVRRAGGPWSTTDLSVQAYTSRPEPTAAVGPNGAFALSYSWADSTGHHKKLARTMDDPHPCPKSAMSGGNAGGLTTRGPQIRLSCMGGFPQSSHATIALHPDIAWNGKSGDAARGLVVWDGVDEPADGAHHGIFGRFVAANGAPVGEQFRISPAVPASPADEFSGSSAATVAYDATRDRYLVAWRNDDASAGNGDVFAQVVGSSGALVGDAQRLTDIRSEHPGDLVGVRASSPKLGYDPEADRYMLALRKDYDDEGVALSEVWAMPLGVDGAPASAGESIGLSGGYRSYDGDLALAPGQAARWGVLVTDELGYALRQLDAGGQPTGDLVRVSDARTSLGRVPSSPILGWSTVDHSWLAAFMIMGDTEPEDDHLQARRVRPDGSLGAPVVLAGPTGEHRPWPRGIAYAPQSREYLLTYDSALATGGSDAWARRVGENGTPHGAAFRAIDRGTNADDVPVGLEPVAAHVPSTNEFLVVAWGEPEGETEVYLRRAGANSPPTASFAAPAEHPMQNVATSFASDSTDPDGQDVTARWDLDGDGGYDDHTGTTATTTFTTPGQHEVGLEVEDADGLTATLWRTITVDPDTTAPDLTSAGPASLTNDEPVTFSASSTDTTATLTCRLDGPATDTGSWATCPTSRELAGLADGAYTLRIKAVDPAGNASDEAVHAFTVDRTAPPLTVGSTPSGATNATSVAIDASSTDAGATITCRLDRPGAAGTSETCPASYTIADEGAYTLAVTARDVAGNAKTETRTWTVDRSAPDTTIATGPSGTTNATTAAFGFTSPDSGAHFQCQIDVAPAAGWQACDQATWSGLAAGVHTLRARAVDAAGNADPSPATRGWTIDPGSASQQVSGTVAGGGSVASGDAPTAQSPVVAAVITPVAGDVTLTERPVAQPAPADWQFFGRELQIEAPAATAADPLRLTFVVDGASLPSGVTAASLTVFRNGAPIVACATPSSTTATPDPCVLSRETLTGGDVRITVLSSHASTWNVGRAKPPVTDDSDDDGTTTSGGGTGNGGGSATAAPATTPPPAAARPPAVVTPPSLTPPTLTAPKKALTAKATRSGVITFRGLVVRCAGSGPACRVRATLGKGRKRLGRRSASIAAGGRKGLTVRVKPAALRTVAGRRRTVKLTLAVTVTRGTVKTTRRLKVTIRVR